VTAAPLSAEAFTSRLRDEGARRYHDRHPFHVRMNDGDLTPAELRSWVTNRYYYQTRIPIKDALILAKSDDPAFRRAWRRRLADHDGDDVDPGGIARWEALAAACGTSREALLSHAGVGPQARAACDAYVDFVQHAPLVEAVASSLTECFAPDLMRARIAAWERHYPWVATSGLTYFRERVSRASRDGAEALRFVVARAQSRDEQEACVAALVRKTEILWQLLDAIQAEGAAP
jgi:pyrroloquinoline-quinone synthase